jgi:CspA family cold shock protein
MTTETGIVARFFDDRGFGFVIPDDQGPDVFVHISQCPGQVALKRGTPVTFEIVDRKGRCQAVNVQHRRAIGSGAPREAPRFGDLIRSLEQTNGQSTAR